MDVVRFIATAGYSGHSKIMPGTCGTAVALLLAIVVYSPFPCLNMDLGFNILGFNSHCGFSGLVGWIIPLFLALAGLGVCSLALKRKIFGNEVSDPQQIVIDEVAGYFVAIAGLGNGILTLLYAFVLFRILDMTKPPPIRQCERLPGAWGIMADDIAAGLVANCFLRALIYFS